MAKLAAGSFGGTEQWAELKQSSLAASLSNFASLCAAMPVNYR